MKAIILAAGYATRLYPLTVNTPKPLLEIGGRSIIDYIQDGIEKIDDIDEIFVVTNHKFYNRFVEWRNRRNSAKHIRVVDDGTTTDEMKLGAIGDINFVIKNEKLNDDIMVVAGDNFFTFELADFYDFFTSINKDCICVGKIKDEKTLRRMGVAVLDDKGKVLDMEEKPVEPKSSIAVYALYIYKRDTLPLFDCYIKEGNEPDAPGYFPAWLYRIKDVYAYVVEGEIYDIGTHESYRDVCRRFMNGLVKSGT